MEALKSWIQTNYKDKPPSKASCTEHSKFKNESGIIFPYREFCEMWSYINEKVLVLSSFYDTDYSYVILQTEFVEKLINFLQPFHIFSKAHSIAPNRVILRFYTPITKNIALLDFIIASFKEEVDRSEVYRTN